MTCDDRCDGMQHADAAFRALRHDMMIYRTAATAVWWVCGECECISCGLCDGFEECDSTDTLLGILTRGCGIFAGHSLEAVISSADAVKPEEKAPFRSGMNWRDS